jgi:DNA-binding GntR family transcriptional regulator
MIERYTAMVFHLDQKPNQVYEALRSDILAFQLAPELALSERWLEDRYGASRTPIRAALARLESEGLVLRDGRVRRVAPLSLDEMREAVVYRAMLEREAVRLFTPRATEAELQVLHTLGTTDAEATEPGQSSVEGVLTAAELFHLEIARMSGNRFLARAVEEVMMRLYRARYMAALSPEGRARAASEHIGIVAAIREGDAEKASARMGAHVEAAGAHLMERLTAGGAGVVVPFRVVA